MARDFAARPGRRGGSARGPGVQPDWQEVKPGSYQTGHSAGALGESFTDVFGSRPVEAGSTPPPRLSAHLSASGDEQRETPKIATEAQRSLQCRRVEWRMPVEERKGMRAGTAWILLDAQCGGAGWGAATPGDGGETGDLGAAPEGGGGGTGTREPGWGVRTTPGIWFPLAYMHCWYAKSYRR